MTKVKSIFGEFENPDAKNDEKNLVENCQDFLTSTQSLLDILINEDTRNKKNERWFTSKELIQEGMVICMLLELIIAELIEEYLSKYGNTAFINKLIPYFINRMIIKHRECIKPYFYLIDIKKCEESLSKCI